MYSDEQEVQLLIRAGETFSVEFKSDVKIRPDREPVVLTNGHNVLPHIYACSCRLCSGVY